MPAPPPPQEQPQIVPTSSNTLSSIDSLCCVRFEGRYKPSELWQIFSSTMNIFEFCAYFPCFCCECKGEYSLKDDDKPCPSGTLLNQKICCYGTPVEEIVSWLCCEEEPPCECCCDTGPCPSPLEEIKFNVFFDGYQLPLPIITEFIKILSEDFGGYSCCLQNLQPGSGGAYNCAGVTDAFYIRTCLDPKLISSFKDTIRSAIGVISLI